MQQLQEVVVGHDICYFLDVVQITTETPKGHFFCAAIQPEGRGPSRVGTTEGNQKTSK